MFWKRVALTLTLLAVSAAGDFAHARKGGGLGGGHVFLGGVQSFSFGTKSFPGAVRSFSYGGVRPFYGAAGGPYNVRPFYPAFSHHRFRHHRFRGAPFVVLGAYPLYGIYSYADGCYWLKRQALYTGNPYWLEQYEECRYDYEY
jgi:hypothetical protein